MDVCTTRLSYTQWYTSYTTRRRTGILGRIYLIRRSAPRDLVAVFHRKPLQNAPPFIPLKQSPTVLCAWHIHCCSGVLGLHRDLYEGVNIDILFRDDYSSFIKWLRFWHIVQWHILNTVPKIVLYHTSSQFRETSVVMKFKNPVWNITQIHRARIQGTEELHSLFSSNSLSWASEIYCSHISINLLAHGPTGNTWNISFDHELTNT